MLLWLGADPGPAGRTRNETNSPGQMVVVLAETNNILVLLLVVAIILEVVFAKRPRLSQLTRSEHWAIVAGRQLI